MTEQRFRVGIVGLEPGRGSAARAHVPARRALSASYEIVGIANTSLASAQRAAAALGLPRAFNDVAELVSAPEVDIVTVTVKVPHHVEVVKAAIEAGKQVYCVGCFLESGFSLARRSANFFENVAGNHLCLVSSEQSFGDCRVQIIPALSGTRSGTDISSAYLTLNYAKPMIIALLLTEDIANWRCD
jgi:hypothetical protein